MDTIFFSAAVLALSYFYYIFILFHLFAFSFNTFSILCYLICSKFLHSFFLFSFLCRKISNSFVFFSVGNFDSLERTDILTFIKILGKGLQIILIAAAILFFANRLTTHYYRCKFLINSMKTYEFCRTSHSMVF